MLWRFLFSRVGKSMRITISLLLNTGNWFLSEGVFCSILNNKKTITSAYFAGLFVWIFSSFYAISKKFNLLSLYSEIVELTNWKIKNSLESEPQYRFLRNRVPNTAEICTESVDKSLNYWKVAHTYTHPNTCDYFIWVEIRIQKKTLTVFFG